MVLVRHFLLLNLQDAPSYIAYRWYSTHHPQADGSDFYDYRLRTYGPEWSYDDTFPDFNASNYDPKE